MIGLTTSTSGNHNLSKMTLAHRTTRHARAAPLYLWIVRNAMSQSGLNLPTKAELRNY